MNMGMDEGSEKKKVGKYFQEKEKLRKTEQRKT